MRRGPAKLAAVTCVLFLATFTAGASSTAAVSVWSAMDMATVDTSNVIPAGWPSHYEAKQCAWKGSCPELAGTAFADVDISDAMADYEDGAVFEVSNGVANPLTGWYVCSFDDSGTILDCWRGSGSWGMRGELSSDARELRLLPLHSAANEYHLRMYVW